MAKFRALSIDELESMEKEFVDFLVLNGIPGDDWLAIKNEDPDKAEGICEAFSDVVFTKILKNCRYIERHSNKEVVSIFCDQENMFLLGLEAPDSLAVDFTNVADFKLLQSNPPEGLQVIKSQKAYNEEREIEIWNLLNNGFSIADQKLYMAIFNSIHE